MKNNKNLIKKNSFKINSNTINKHGSPYRIKEKEKGKVFENIDKKTNNNNTINKNSIKNNNKKEELKNKNSDANKKLKKEELTKNH